MILDRVKSPLSPERAALAGRWVRYVQKWAQQKSGRDEGHFYELCGVGNDALVIAASRYEARNGASFVTLLKWELRSALDNRRRMMATRKRCNGKLTDGGRGDLIVESSPDDPTRGAVDGERRAAIEAAIEGAGLRERSEYVIRRIFWGGASQAEVAAELGVTKQRVCELKDDALTKIARCSGLATLARYVGDN